MAQNVAWKVETYGIDAISDNDRKGKPSDLFWIWFAANIGILGVLYGGIIVGFHLSFFQSTLAAFIGSLSFIIVGILSLAGRDGGAPMLVLSRTIFGARGNLAPTVVSWINLLGWESVTVVTGALSLDALLQTIFHGKSAPVETMISVIVFASLVILFGLLGQATLVVVQKAATWLFGLLTLAVIIQLILDTHWRITLSAPSGSWISGFLPAVSIIIAGTGISWGNTAADFSRYQQRKSPTKSIVYMVTAGGAIPLFILMMVGVLLIGSAPAVGTAANPIDAIGKELPGWMTIPYLLAAVGGLVAEADLSLYSSGLNLMVIGLRVARYKSVVIDAAVMIFVSVYVLFVSQNFMGLLESFLSLMGIGLASWEAIFIAYQFSDKYVTLARRQHRSALICWCIGSIFGLLFTNSSLYHSPFASGIFANSSLGVLLSFFISGILYFATIYVRQS